MSSKSIAEQLSAGELRVHCKVYADVALVREALLLLWPFADVRYVIYYDVFEYPYVFCKHTDPLKFCMSRYALGRETISATEFYSAVMGDAVELNVTLEDVL